MIVFGKFTCPYCFHKFSLWQTCFRCTYDHCSARAYDDTFDTWRHLETSLSRTPMGYVIKPTETSWKKWFSVPRVASCQECKHESREAICPRCHYKLPPAFWEGKQVTIVVIGGRGTGKTNYIVALMKRMEYDVGKNFGILVERGNEETTRRLQRDFDLLFVQKTVLAATQPAQIDATIQTPLIFHFRFKESRKVLVVCLFDTAGEDMGDFARLMYIPAIQNANALIFLLDPSLFDGIQPQLSAGAKRNDTPQNIVDRVTQHFHQLGSKKITIPVAFVLSKADILRSHPDIPEDSSLHEESRHAVSIDLSDVQSMSTEIEGYLPTWLTRDDSIATNFTDVIEEQFPKHHYFWLSSLGEQPDANGHLQNVNPFRVEDPFLWILYKLRFIKGRR